MRDPAAKLRKRVEKALKRGSLREAIELGRELCLADERPESWAKLAKLAHAAGDVQTEVAARMSAAKLQNPGASEWLELDAVAARAGMADAALDARFRAADACARAGDCRRALELCDAVLAASPGHAAAKRIRAIMASRLERAAPPTLPPLEPDEPDTGKMWPPPPEPPPIEMVAEPAPRRQPTGRGWPAVAPEPASPAEADTGKQWPPARQLAPVSPFAVEALEQLARSDVELVAGVAPAPAAGGGRAERPPSSEFAPTTTQRTSAMLDALRAGAVDEARARANYVCSPQKWPTVLDWHSLMFVGSKPALADDLAALAQPLELGPEQPVYRQGEASQVLYCLDEGEVSANRLRGFFQDFGTVRDGFFFGEAGAISGLPSTTSVTALVPCRMRVITRDTIQRPTRESARRVAQLISTLRSYYLELAVSMCPLLAQLQPAELEAVAQSERWSIFKPGARIAAQGERGPLYVIVVGMARVMMLPEGGPELLLGYLTTGDLVGNIDPCPVSVVAEALTFAITVERDRIRLLPDHARADLERRAGECQQVLEDIAAEVRMRTRSTGA
jgi:CRP-like cAMP-binding protein